jgi:hypothetical protein
LTARLAAAKTARAKAIAEGATYDEAQKAYKIQLRGSYDVAEYKGRGVDMNSPDAKRLVEVVDKYYGDQGFTDNQTREALDTL